MENNTNQILDNEKMKAAIKLQQQKLKEANKPLNELSMTISQSEPKSINYYLFILLKEILRDSKYVCKTIVNKIKKKELQVQILKAVIEYLDKSNEKYNQFFQVVDPTDYLLCLTQLEE